MKKLILAALFLTACNQSTITPSTPTEPAAAVSQDTTVAEPASADETKIEPKPLTLKEKLSIASKELELINMSYMPFCSKTPKDLNLFYTTLFYEMIRHESGFKNEEAYYECAKAKCHYSSGCFTDPVRGFCRITSSKMDGGFAVSRGLFQLSVSSVQNLGCKEYIKTSADLHNEDKNIKCALEIAKRYFLEDKVITAKAEAKWKGLSRYWAVLRPEFDGKPRSSYLKIEKEMKKLEGCN